MVSNNVNLCWISGGYFDSKDTLQKIISFLDKPTIFKYGDDDNPYSIESSINEISLFEANRIFILEFLAKFDGMSDAKSNQRWINLLSNIPDNTIVILYGLDKSKYKKIFEHITKIGKIFLFPKTLGIVEGKEYCIKLVENNGKKIDTNDLTVLLETAIGSDKEYNVDILRMNCEKLFRYTGKNKKITASDISVAIKKSNEYVIWDIINAFEKKDLVLCINLFGKACKTSSVPAVTRMILNMLAWKIKLLLLIKENMVDGKNKEEVVKNVQSLHKFKIEHGIIKAEETVNGTLKNAYSPQVINMCFYNNRGVPSIDAFSRVELFRIIQAIDDCLIRIRYDETDEVCTLMLYSVFMTVCNVIDYSSGNNMRRNIYGKPKRYA